MVDAAPQDMAGAQRVLIIMTDGDANRRIEETNRAVQAANAAGVVRYVVGVGQRVERAGLEAISSNPKGEHVFDVAAFSDLSATLGPLLEAVSSVRGTDIVLEALVDIPFTASNASATHGDVVLEGNTVTWTIPEHSAGDATLSYDVRLSCMRREMSRPIHRLVRYHDAEHHPVAFPDLSLVIRGCVDRIFVDAPTGTPTAGANLAYSATVTDGHGDPAPGVELFFEVRSGPNAGTLGRDITGEDGVATFAYDGLGGPGDDVVWARTVSGINVSSNELTVSWQ